MSPHGRRWERPAASIEELRAAVRQESAAALGVAEAFLPDTASRQVLTVPRRFPGPDRLPGQPDPGPGDQGSGPRQSSGPA